MSTCTTDRDAVLDISDRTVCLLRIAANRHRLGALLLLARREHYAGELAAGVGLDQTAFAQHLRLLRASGAVSTRRVGQHHYYGLTAAGKAVLRAAKAVTF